MPYLVPVAQDNWGIRFDFDLKIILGVELILYTFKRRCWMSRGIPVSPRYDFFPFFFVRAENVYHERFGKVCILTIMSSKRKSEESQIF